VDVRYGVLLIQIHMDIVLKLMLNVKTKMSKETECPHCHKVGFHKLSCPTQKVTVSLSDVKVEGATKRRCKNHVWRKDYLNGGKKCQVCGKAREEVKRSKDVEE
jgi:hypothetical protein